jgi:hypothetical protein
VVSLAAPELLQLLELLNSFSLFTFHARMPCDYSSNVI